MAPGTAGVFNVPAGASLLFDRDGGYRFKDGTHLLGAGRFHVGAATAPNIGAYFEGTVTIGTPTVAGTFEFGPFASSYASNGTLVSNGTFNWTGGELDDNLLLIPANGVLNISGDNVKILGGHGNPGTGIDNRGTMTWTGAGNLDARFETITNESGATFNAQSSGQLTGTNGYGIFNNLPGAIFNANDNSGTGTTRFDGQFAFNNSGLVNVLSGTLDLGGGGTNTVVAAASTSGVFHVPSGATLLFSSAYHLKDGTQLLGMGHFRVFNAQPGVGLLSLNGSVALGTLAEAGSFDLGTGGTVGDDNSGVGHGTLINHGEFNWTGGTWNSSLQITPDGALTISGDEDKKLTGDGNRVIGTIYNAGHASWSGAGNIVGSTGTFTNQNGGVFSALSSGAFTGSEKFVNSGSLEIGSPLGTLNFPSQPNVGAWNFTQTATGVLNLDIAGTTPGSGFDQFNVGGASTLDGTLNVRFLNGYVPPLGATFPVLSYLVNKGSFARLTGAGRYFTPSYNATGLVLRTSSVPLGPVLSLSKTAFTNSHNSLVLPITAVPQEDIHYTLTYSNTGDATATDVTVSDPLPGGTSFVSAGGTSGDGSRRISGTLSNGVVTWSVGDVPAGASQTLVFTAQVNARIGAIIHNRDYTIHNAISSKPGTTGDVQVTVVNPLSVTKKVLNAGLSYAPGELLKYLLTVTNTASFVAGNVSVSDPLPADPSYYTASFSDARGNPLSGSAQPLLTTSATGTRIITWNLGNLGPEVHYLSLNVRVKYDPQHSLITNSGYGIHGTSPAGTPDDLAVADNPPVSIAVGASDGRAPQLGLSQAVVTPNSGGRALAEGATAFVGDTLTYSFYYLNTGSADASNVILTAHVPTLPSGARLIPLRNSISAGGRYDARSGLVQWSLGTVKGNAPSAANSAGFVFFQVKVPAQAAPGTLLSNQACRLTSDDLNTTINGTPSSSEVRILAPATLSLKLLTEVDSVEADNTLTYNLFYGNSGDVSASNVVIRDTVPGGSSFVAASDGGTLSGSTVTWRIGTLLPNHFGSVTLTVQASGNRGGAGVLSNSASIEDGRTSANTGTLSTPVTVSSSARLTVDVQAPSFVAQNGSTILTSVISYSNLSGQTAHGVLLSSPVDVARGTLLHDAASTSAGFGTTSNSIFWNKGDLAPGASGAVKYSVRLLSTFTGGLVNNGTSITARNAALVYASPAGTGVLSRAAVQRLASRGGLEPLLLPFGLDNFFVNLWNNLVYQIRSRGAAAALQEAAARRDALGAKARADVEKISISSRSLGIGGADLVQLKNGAVLIATGNGQVKVEGPAGVITAGAGNVITSGAGNVITSGAGNAISIDVGGGLGKQTAAYLLTPGGIGRVITSGAGNVITAGAGNLIARSASGQLTFRDNNTGALLGTIAERAPGVITSGAGNVITLGAGNVITSGAGNIVGKQVTSVITLGAGNVITSGAGNVITSGAGNVITSGAGN